MKNAFNGLTNRLDTAEERIFKLKDISRKSSKSKSKDNTEKKKQKRKYKNCRTATKSVIYL